MSVTVDRAIQKATRQMPGRYEFDESTPIALIKERLEETRKTSNIYRTARVIQALRDRGEKVHITSGEKLRLANAIHKARYGEHLPMAKWLPRGYQIARLLAVAKSLLPHFNATPTARDADLIRKAAKHIKKDKRFERRQLVSLIQTADYLGVTIHHV